MSNLNIPFITSTSNTFYYGDLCYVLNREDWLEICSKIEGNNLEKPEKVTFFSKTLNKEVSVILTSTYNGDGFYEAERMFYKRLGEDLKLIIQNKNLNQPVDSGTLGIIAIEDVSKKDFNTNLGVVFQLNNVEDILTLGLSVNLRENDNETFHSIDLIYGHKDELYPSKRNIIFTTTTEFSCDCNVDDEFDEE